jgi:serine protease AprX
MTISLALSHRIRWGLAAGASTAMLALLVVLATLPATSLTHGATASSEATSGIASTPLVRLADNHPGRSVEAIVQFENGVSSSSAHKLVRANGGRVTGDLPIINGLVARTTASAAEKLAARPGVRAVSLNARVKRNSIIDPNKLATSFNASIQSTAAWDVPGTGKGVGVAVIDTGIAGNLADFRVSQTDTSSRVIGSAVTNPLATTATDTYGHGTHVAGIIAGNSTNRPSSDPLDGKYAGVAPEANLISIKTADDAGNATVLDVIYGLQFAVDFKDTYNIRVVNLSLESTQAQSYKTDPLDAAAEAAWFKGIVVVAAAGNRGTDSDAVQYAPGNDPYVISVGAADDYGTSKLTDDTLASWSSRGVTQDGYAKPEITAPGAHIVSNLAPGSAFASLCPTCIVDGQYIRAGGTSMAAPMVAGAVADLLQRRPELTPDQIKQAVIDTARSARNRFPLLGAWGLTKLTGTPASANRGLTPSTLIDTATGDIDYTRSSWSKSRWSTATSNLRSSWSRSSWSCNCSTTSSGTIDPTRSRWSRSSWSTSWTK